MNWRNRYLETVADLFECVRAMQPVAREVAEKEHPDLDDSWNPDHHLELTLSVSECRRIQDLVKKHTIPAEPETAGAQ